MGFEIEGSPQRHDLGYLGPEVLVRLVPHTVSNVYRFVSIECDALGEGVVVKNAGLDVKTSLVA